MKLEKRTFKLKAQLKGGIDKNVANFSILYLGKHHWSPHSSNPKKMDCVISHWRFLINSNPKDDTQDR